MVAEGVVFNKGYVYVPYLLDFLKEFIQVSMMQGLFIVKFEVSLEQMV
jgi:hypothetical protein